MSTNRYATEQYVQDYVIQSDFNQIDPTKLDYIKNRTHYAYIEGQNLVYDNIFQDVSSGNYYSSYAQPIIAGNKYLIVINNQEYESTALNDYYTINIPNVFIFMQSWAVTFYNISGTVDLKIYDITNRVEHIVKLPDKFIPDTVPVINKSLLGQAIVVKSIDENGKPTEFGTADIINTSNMKAEVGQTVIVKSVDENGKPTDWEIVDLPNPVQADHAQNDINAPDYIKNRLAYDGTQIISTTVNGLYMCYEYDGIIENNKTYIIEIDGTKYERVPNNNILEISERDFKMEWYPSNNCYYITNYSGGKELIVYEKIKKIEERFIPDSIARLNDIQNARFNSILMIDEIDGYEYSGILRNGVLVFVPKCVSINVTKLPTKRDYDAGDDVDLTGIEVKITRSNGEISVLDNYKYSNKVYNNIFEVYYIEGGVKYSDYIEFTVSGIIDEEKDLIDFEYIIEDDGSYTITGWKGTLNGEPSTILSVPNSKMINL